MNPVMRVISRSFTASQIIVCVLAAVYFMISPAIVAGEQSQREIKIVAFGDSLTAGFGLAKSQAFPARLEAALQKRGYNVRVLNAGISGDTTSGGLARLDWSIPKGTDGVILELGANDALQGLPPKLARKNLDEMITRLKSRNIAVLLTGMKALRNWGDDYVAAFDPIFADLSSKHDVLLYPFFLEGVALDPNLNLPDGLHPNAKGIEKIVVGILPKSLELIERVRQSKE